MKDQRFFNEAAKANSAAATIVSEPAELLSIGTEELNVRVWELAVDRELIPHISVKFKPVLTPGGDKIVSPGSRLNLSM